MKPKEFIDAKIEMGDIHLATSPMYQSLIEVIEEFNEVDYFLRKSVGTTGDDIKPWIKYNKERKEWLQAPYETETARVLAKPNKPNHYK